MVPFQVLFVAVIAGSFAFPSNPFDGRIIGGSDAEEGTYTYQVSLRRRDDIHFCGGSIIDATTVLTAKHCIAGKKPEKIIVVAGSLKLDQGGVRHEVSAIKTHISRDIGILLLKDPIQFNVNVSAVELESERVASNEKCVVSGWGMIDENKTKPNHLQYIVLRTVSSIDCRARGESVQEEDVCTFTKEGEGICYGDSGGPLVLIGNKKQIGIVSRGQLCAIGYPDIYTEVAPFIRWINENKN